MAEWDRRTPWRQGHILTTEAVNALQLVPNVDPSDSFAIVITHDCDLAQTPSVEPLVEVIIGRRIEEADGNFTHGKNPRRLHLPATEHGTPIYLEFIATARKAISKGSLAEHVPSAEIVIGPTERNTLQFWLAARYRRSAFPDEFDRRLKETGLARRMAKILEPLGRHIVAVFFDVDEGVEREHQGADDPFTLSIDLLYSTDLNPQTAEDAATAAAQQIDRIFRDRCFDEQAKSWREIELVECEPIADEALTYAMSLRLKRWNADYISLPADPVQPLMCD